MCCNLCLHFITHVLHLHFSVLPRVNSGVPQAVKDQIIRANRMRTEIEVASKGVQNTKLLQLVGQLQQEDVMCLNTLVRMLHDQERQLDDAHKELTDAQRENDKLNRKCSQLEEKCARYKPQFYKSCGLCGKDLDNKHNYHTHRTKCKKDHLKKPYKVISITCRYTGIWDQLVFLHSATRSLDFAIK